MNRWTFVRNLAWAFLLIIGIGVVAASAAEDASVTGNVADPLGGRVAGARVTLTRGGTQTAETVSDARGEFVFNAVASDRYQILVTAAGFEPQSTAPFFVGAGRTIVDVSLQIGQLRQDVVVTASRWEGMSLVPLEAMATGRSVVATDVSGAREAIGDRAGAIVPIGDVEALVEAAAARLLDRERADREGEAGRQRVETSFDVRLMTEKLAALAQRVAARDGSARASSSTEPTIP